MAQNGVNIYGYVRVSTSRQDTDHQRKFITNHLSKIGDRRTPLFVDEEISSRKPLEKRALYHLLTQQMNPGDTLYVSDMSRITRSGLGEIGRITTIIKERDIEVVFINNDITINGNLDLKTELLITVLSIAAKIEREITSERVKSGLHAKMRMGLKVGRRVGQTISKEQSVKMESLRSLGLSYKKISNHLPFHSNTIALYFRRKNIMIPSKS